MCAFLQAIIYFFLHLGNFSWKDGNRKQYFKLKRLKIVFTTILSLFKGSLKVLQKYHNKIFVNNFNVSPPFPFCGHKFLLLRICNWFCSL